MDWLGISLAMTAVLLGHQDFDIREQATRGAGPEAALLAGWRGDPEIAVRGEQVAILWDARRRALVLELIEAYEADYGDLPWIDALPGDWPNRDEIHLRYYNLGLQQAQLTPDASKPHLSYRYATRFYLLDQRVETVRLAFKRMPNDHRWWSTYHPNPGGWKGYQQIENQPFPNVVPAEPPRY